MNPSINKERGYHFADIPKGRFGEIDKVVEEALEVADAAAQGVEIMILVELSDLIGAVRGYLRARHPSLDIDDIIAMADVTERAFRSGER